MPEIGGKVKVDARRDEDIDFSDLPEQDETFFKNAVLKMPQPKVAVTLRLEHENE